MENYGILYTISIVHDYFDGCPCPSIACRLSPEGERLARQRKLLFRQTGTGTWTILFDKNADSIDTDHDVLELQLHLTDGSFVYYTNWPEFKPTSAYGLALPQQQEELEVKDAIRPVDRKRAIGEGFCTIRLTLTSKMVDVAHPKKPSDSPKPMKTVLHFRAPKMWWKYLFFFRDMDKYEVERLKLVDTMNKLTFTGFKQEKGDEYGRKALVATSKSTVEMRQSYGCRLRLIAVLKDDDDNNEEEEKKKKIRVLLPHVSPPEPGRFIQEFNKGILRQVCYY